MRRASLDRGRELTYTYFAHRSHTVALNLVEANRAIILDPYVSLSLASARLR